MCQYRTDEVVTIGEEAESDEMIETAVDEAQHERIPRRRKRPFESDFFYYQTNLRKIDKYFGGSREQRKNFRDQGNMS